MTSSSGSGDRILAILDLFTAQNAAWTPDAMMAALGYSRPTLYRYLKTLKSAGYLVASPGGSLTLGPRVTELDFLLQRSDPLITTGTPFLKILAARYPGAALLTRWYGRKILCIASEVSTDQLVSSYPRGQPMPLARGGISRVILAHLPRREQDLLIAVDNQDALQTASDDADIHETYRLIRKAGFCTAWGEVTPGAVGVAAPILAGERMPIGAISLTSVAATTSAARLEQIQRDIRDSAAAISGMIVTRAAQRLADTPQPLAAIDRLPQPRRLHA